MVEQHEAGGGMALVHDLVADMHDGLAHGQRDAAAQQQVGPEDVGLAHLAGDLGDQATVLFDHAVSHVARGDVADTAVQPVARAFVL